MDFTLSLMVIAVKAILVSWCTRDGLWISQKKRLHSKDRIHNEMASRALSTRMNLLEYASYIWFYGTVLTGPCFGPKHFLECFDSSIYRKAGFQNAPSTFLPSLLRLLKGLAAFPGFFLSKFFPVLGFMDTDLFLEFSLMQRILYMCTAAVLARWQFYLGFYTAEGGCIAAGLGFSFEKSDKEILVSW